MIMSNTDVEALKELYTKMGGDDDVATINTSSEMIRKLGEVVESGGGSDEDSSGEKEDIIIPLGAYNSELNSYTLGGGFTYDSIIGLIRDGKYNLIINILKTNPVNGNERTVNYIFRYTSCNDYVPYNEYNWIHFCCSFNGGDDRPNVQYAKIYKQSDISYVQFMGYALSVKTGGPFNFEN